MKHCCSGLLALLLSLLIALPLPAFAVGYTQTKYPIVMVGGIFGFDTLAGVPYFYQIPKALTSGGAQVYVAEVSSINDETVRGEQLLSYVQQVLAVTGASKVNLIGHSQGGLTVRYVGAVRPDLIASVTSIGTPHTGAPLADVLAGVADGLPGLAKVIGAIVNGVGVLIELLSGGVGNPQDALAALEQLSSAGAVQYNATFPQGIPTTACGNGAPQVNGVNYYSWGGTSLVTNILDPSDLGMVASSLAFVIAPSPNDGLVPQCASHLGTVIADNYTMNHLDEVNQLFGLHSGKVDPVSLFRLHANRLQLAGL